MGLMHLQRAGHRPFALVGGGTGHDWRPERKDRRAAAATPRDVAENTRAIRKQLEKFLDFSGRECRADAQQRGLADALGAVDFMRDVGKHFTINYMLAKESVQLRIEVGISYTEFSYMLLQAYDFRELFRRDGVTLQVGGSDQWGNITAGLELIRRTEAATHMR